MNLLNYDISKRQPFSETAAHIFGGTTIPILLIVSVFAGLNLIKAARQKRPTHVVAIHFFVALLTGARVLLIILGTDHPDAFIGRLDSAPVPPILMQFLDNLGDGSLLAACCLELAMFVRVGWAATLQIKHLTRAHIFMRLTYFACASGIVAEVLSGCLISAEHQSLRIFIAIVIGIEILAVLSMLLVLRSTLIDIATMVSKRKKVTLTSAKWSPPVDARDMNLEPVKPKNTPIQHPKILSGFLALPKRARVAFVAVVFGILLIAVQCTEKFGELMFQFAGKQAFHGPELTHITYRILEGFVGFAISHSSSVISTPDSKKSNRDVRQSQSASVSQAEDSGKYSDCDRPAPQQEP